MGENLDAQGRMAVRTPMQWTSGRNGGFSAAAPSRLPGPVVQGGFGPEYINVQDQRQDPDSLLAFITLLIRRYRECPELGWGTFEVLAQPVASVLAHRCTWAGSSLVALHNLAGEAVAVPLVLAGCSAQTQLIDLLAAFSTTTNDAGVVTVQLPAYGFRWLRVVPPGERRLI